jgi:hypothetical protein
MILVQNTSGMIIKQHVVVTVVSGRHVPVSVTKVTCSKKHTTSADTNVLVAGVVYGRLKVLILLVRCLAWVTVAVVLECFVNHILVVIQEEFMTRSLMPSVHLYRIGSDDI